MRRDRVVSFMLGNGGSPRSYEFLGVHGGHHELSHHRKRPETLDKLQKIDTWEVAQLAYLLERMDAVNEGDGSLLDHSAVLFSSEIEDGDTHSPLQPAGADRWWPWWLDFPLARTFTCRMPRRSPGCS